jgi:formylmethanofuran dehydrogenase subunit B
MTEASNTFKDIICTFCGCLCDDIMIDVEGNKIIKNTNGCAISKERFVGCMENRCLHPTVKGNTVTLEKAIERVVEIITSSKRLLIYGLSSTENDAQREAYRLAELTGSVVDNTTSVCHGPTILGAQESGEATASLAETRHRADLVIYWGSNPAAAHPRHIPHYIRQPGEYIKDPKKDRQIWLVDVRETTTARMADRFVKINPASDLEVIQTLRALIRGIKLDVTEVGGISINELEEIATAMKNAKYGVLFFGLGLTQSWGRHRNIDAAIRLIQDLNAHTKWGLMPMRGHYNVSGANKTSTWVTGYPYAIDFARGYPRFSPGEYTAVDMLARGEADAMLNIAADPVAHFPRAAVEHLASIPVINIDPKFNMTSQLAEVNIPAAIAGIECDGAATRMDGLPLYLKKVIDPPEGVIPDRDILRMMIKSLEKVMK